MNNSTCVANLDSKHTNLKFLFYFFSWSKSTTKGKDEIYRVEWLWSQFNFGYVPVPIQRYVLNSNGLSHFGLLLNCRLVFLFCILWSGLEAAAGAAAAQFRLSKECSHFWLNCKLFSQLLASKPPSMMMIIINIFAQVFANQSCLANW